MTLPELAIRRPVTALTVLVSLVVLGLVALVQVVAALPRRSLEEVQPLRMPV